LSDDAHASAPASPIGWRSVRLAHLVGPLGEPLLAPRDEVRVAQRGAAGTERELAGWSGQDPVHLGVVVDHVRNLFAVPWSTTRHGRVTLARKIHAMPTVQTRAEERFAAAMAVVVRRLPWGLARVVPPSLAGFAVINGCTFGVDIVLLSVLRSVAGLPLWLSISTAYVCAFGLSYVLNRTFNFRSHAPAGPQVVVYVVVVVVNYLVWILGVSAGLAVLGVDYRVARVVAGVCEAVYMYCAMRWIVFRRR
jgi:putative flippase GtrA